MRVPDLHAFRLAIAAVTRATGGDPRSHLIVVPTRGAAVQLRRTLQGFTTEDTARKSKTTEDTEVTEGQLGFAFADSATAVTPDIVTRDELLDRLHARLHNPPRRLTAYEREAMLRAAAREASEAAGASLRPGLVAEMLRFYDQLRSQARTLGRFEALAEETLGGDAEFDRGAARLLAQTRVLVAAFRAYERRVADAGACDDHALVARLVAEPARDPVRCVTVTVGDWIADPNGLRLADFDLLARIPGLESLDLIATDALLGSGFHQRLHDWLPGIEEIGAAEVGVMPAVRRPMLCVPADAPERGYFVSRDREEELVDIARRLKADLRASQTRVGQDFSPALDRVAVVYKRPLPYLYLGRTVFGAAGIPFQSSDALPLAAEPFAAAVDLVLDCAASDFTRDSLVSLLRSPHFAFDSGAGPLTRSTIADLDRRLSDERYLGGLDRLAELAPDVAEIARELAPLRSRAAASAQMATLVGFLARHARPDAEPPSSARDRRARAAILASLEALAGAHAAYDDAPCDVEELTGTIRRWIEEETFVPESADEGLHLIDDHAARYGDFDQMTIVGLVEGEWPERPRRNIFYPSSLLASLGWPSERDRRGAAEARFVDLLGSASTRVAVSTITLDEETLVEVSTLVDELPRARLSSIAVDARPAGRIFVDEALSLDPPRPDVLEGGAREWAALRLRRSPHDHPAFHGEAGPQAARSGAWSVSALETWLSCPFKFFAQHVLRLEEEPDDEEVMDPRAEGEFVHQVFEDFFRAWQSEGRGAIAPATLDAARELFATIVERRVAPLSGPEAALQRTRLLGSPAAAGLGEAVLRMEVERPTPVVARLLEHRLEGPFAFATDAGTRTIALRGKADRIDLLADGTFRLVDYKLGRAPQRTRALQLPIYSLCAAQQLNDNGGYRGRRWTLGEAAYVAFGGSRRIAPLFASAAERDETLARAQARLVEVVDAVERGEFPPRPHDVTYCTRCSYAAVCRKDYVGDV